MLERWLLAAMLITVSAVALAMFVDETREFDSSVEALQLEQSALATAVAADFEARLAAYEEDQDGLADSATVIPRLLGGAIALEQPRSRIFLLARPGRAGLLSTSGRSVRSALLERALRDEATGIQLPRSEAARLGLPQRVAVAGISRVRSARGPWRVIVLASAERLRARERHAQLRFLLGVGVATLLVTGFGGLALRQQRHRLEAARELAVAALERDRERLLAKTDKMATLAALSSGIAHEVATPLGTITARVEQVLPAVADNVRATAALRVVLDQVERIQRVIRGVLGLSRGEPPAREQAHAEAIARAALSMVQHRLGEAGVSSELLLAGELPAISCERTLLEQALANLLLNACDASRRGSRVRLRVELQQELLAFVVEDEGEGIPAETAERARDPFFTTKPSGHGTGLGLAIAQEIVSSHGGSLSLETREAPRGTRATIRLQHL